MKANAVCFVFLVLVFQAILFPKLCLAQQGYLHGKVAFIELNLNKKFVFGGPKKVSEAQIAENTRILQHLLLTVKGQASDGWGTNYRLRKDTLLVGSIRVVSGNRLWIEKGAVLMASPYLEHYPDLPKRIRSTQNAITKAFIWSDSATFITFCGYGNGRGTIDFNGAAFPAQAKDRPCGFLLSNSKKIGFGFIKLKNSGFWMLHLNKCQNTAINNIKIYNHANRNNDGIDIVNCQNVKIDRCKIDTDDDAIVIKSLYSDSSKNISITRSTLRSNCNAFKIGTETYGPISNVFISRCKIRPSRVHSEIYDRRMGLAGIAITSVDGSEVSTVLASRLNIKGYYAPFFIRLGKRGRKYAEIDSVKGVGSISGITLERIKCKAERWPEIYIAGLPGYPVTNVKLSRIKCSFMGGVDSLPKPPLEKETGYPELTLFGKQLPASALYLRHVRGFEMNRVKFTVRSKDTRPLIVKDDVE